MSSGPCLPPAGDGLLLVLVAAPREAASVVGGVGASEAGEIKAWSPSSLSPGADLVLTGVGKANAAGALAHFFDRDRHCGVLNIGVAGALPESGVGLLESVAATWSLLADEGLMTGDGFQTTASMGFPPGPVAHDDVAQGAGFQCDLDWVEAVRPVVTTSAPVATVSTCSGTDEAARDIRKRTGAACEAMEGGAIANALARLDSVDPLSRRTPFLELRVISNTTGDREGQRWDLDGALERLAALSQRVIGPGA